MEIAILPKVISSAMMALLNIMVETGTPARCLFPWFQTAL